MNLPRLAGILACVLTFAVSPAQDVFQKTNTQAEIELGREAYDSILQSGRLSRNPDYILRVRRVLSQLETAMPERLFPFQAVVIADTDLNAFCLPGGYMCVNEGLLARMPDDCDLAFVLGHELGHAVRRHWANKLRKMQRERLFHAITAALTNTAMNEENLALLGLAHSRAAETEADAYGTELYLRAGFDPKRVTSGMQKLADDEKQHGGSRIPTIYLTHPEPARRVIEIDRVATRLEAAGLKPIDTPDVDLSVEKVFGKIPTLAPNECRWQPTVPGTEWEYAVQSPAANSRYRVRAVGVAVVGLTPVVRMEVQVGATPIPYQMIVDGDRVWRRNHLESPTSPWTIEVAFPDDGESLDAGPSHVEFVSLEDLDTLAGHFEKCLKVRVTATGGRTVTAWYAAGTGLVKRVNDASGVTEVLVAIKRP